MTLADLLNTLIGSLDDALSTEEAVAVLELSGVADSVKFVDEMAARGVVNVTPSGDQNRNVPPTWASFNNGKAPKWWIERFVRTSPHWAYVSGHFDGNLYNNPKPPTWLLDFKAPTANNNELWRYYLGVKGVSYRLNGNCQAIIVMGCNAVHFEKETRNLRKLFESSTRKPVVLGFYHTCPKVATAQLVTFFVEELAKVWDRRGSSLYLAECWLNAGRSWAAKGQPGERLGYVAPNDDRFRVGVAADGTWRWIQI